MLMLVTTIIAALASASNLERLVPEGCAVTAEREVWCIGDEGTSQRTWPTIDLVVLAHNPFVTSLALGRVKVQHPAALQTLPRLADLTLYELGKTRFDLAPVFARGRLASLSISADSVVDISAVAAGKQLVELRLEDVAGIDLGFLADLPRLERLFIENVQGVRWGERPWPSSLRLLHIWHGVRATPDHPAEPVPLERLPSPCRIETVDFYFVALSGVEALARCGSLARASVVHTDLATLAPLAGLTGLTKLDLYGGSVTDLTPLAKLTQLTELRLSRIAVTDIGALAELTRLVSLDLSETQVVDVKALSAMQALDSLDLAKTAVAEIESLAGLTKLSSVRLDDTHVRDIKPLASLPKLSILSLLNTPAATSKSVAELRKTRPTVSIYASDDDVPGNP